MEITGHLKLENLLSEFESLETEFRFVAEEYEIETTHGEYIFIDVDVIAEIKYDYEDNSFEVVSKMIDVEVHPTFFTTDRNGGELEGELDGSIMTRLEEEIYKEIEDKLK